MITSTFKSVRSKFKTWALILSVALLVMRCNLPVEEEETLEATKTEVIGAYMGMEPTQTPKLLSPELLASSLEEYNGTFSPDGKEFYFTTNTPKNGIISYTKMGEKGSWSEPRVASFSGVYSEYDPLFSPDGKRLYFSSERPIHNEVDHSSTHIWYVGRNEVGWSEPNLLDLGREGTYYSSITEQGDVYFNIWDTGDMYKAVKLEVGYRIDSLPAILNTSNGEGDPFISPDEEYIIYRGYNNTLGRGDLYISFNAGGKWTEPKNLGEPINSVEHEMCPYVTIDGKYFIFASTRMEEAYQPHPESSLEVLRSKHQSADNGDLNIYYVSTDFIDEMKPVTMEFGSIDEH